MEYYRVYVPGAHLIIQLLEQLFEIQSLDRY